MIQKEGHGMYARGSITKVKWLRACVKKEKLKDSSPIICSLSATSSTELIRNNVPGEVTQEFTGHQSIKCL